MLGDEFICELKVEIIFIIRVTAFLYEGVGRASAWAFRVGFGDNTDIYSKIVAGIDWQHLANKYYLLFISSKNRSAGYVDGHCRGRQV